MKIAKLVPGAGGGFYCENCLRDGALVRAFKRLGHDVVVVPMYLPSGVNGTDVSGRNGIFFGGINVYLQQKLGLFRKTPRWLDKFFDSDFLLRFAAEKAGMTSSKELAETTVSMLKGEYGKQFKELDRLINWLEIEENRPDAVMLSNVMLVGLAGRIRRRLGVKVICMLQDEAGFLDSIEDVYAGQAWDIIRQRCGDVDGFVSVSQFYADVMQERLGVDSIKVVYMGIDLEGYVSLTRRADRPVIGFLSQMCRDKGLDVLVDAFLELRRKSEFGDLRLKIAGGKSGADDEFISGIKNKIQLESALGAVEFCNDFDHQSKVDFLESVSVVSVPEQRQGPSYGLYMLEANAAGVPVVQPDSGAFAELIGMTGGGLVYKDNNAAGLASALEMLLSDRKHAFGLGEIGRKNVFEKFNITDSAGKIVNLIEDVRF